MGYLNSINFNSFSGLPFLFEFKLSYVRTEQIDNLVMKHEESPSTAGEEEIEDQKYHFMSLMLNLVNTFLYMVNTYIIVMTIQ